MCLLSYTGLILEDVDPGEAQTDDLHSIVAIVATLVVK